MRYTNGRVYFTLRTREFPTPLRGVNTPSFRTTPLLLREERGKEGDREGEGGEREGERRREGKGPPTVS